MSRDRPVIYTEDLTEATDRAWEVINQGNDPRNPDKFVFRYGDKPARFTLDERDRRVPRAMGRDELRNYMSRTARWKHSAKADKFQQGANKDVMTNMLAEARMPIPVVRRIV